MDYRGIANEVLRYGAWLNLLGGALLALYFWKLELPTPVDAYGAPTVTASLIATLRAGWIVGSLAGGLMGWAVCYVLCEVSQETRELHHEIRKAMR